MNREKQMATEPMLPLILKMSMPMVLAQLVNLLYNMVDRIYIGHIANVGSQALAGIGLTSSIIILVSAFGNLVGGGGAPLASIALGRGNRKKAEEILGNSFSMLLFFAIVCMAVTYVVKESLLYAIGASAETFPYADSYLSVYLLGTLFVEISTGLSSFITCQGRAGMTMLCVCVGAGLNILLDPLLIFVFDLGVVGAAIATVISQAVSAFMMLRFLFSEKATLRLKSAAMNPQGTVILDICKLGVAPFIMCSTESFVGFVLNGNLQEFGGDIYVSALTVMQSCMQIVSVPMGGFTQGVTPIISYNFGAGNQERVRRGHFIMLCILFSFNFLSILAMITFPRIVGSVFTSDPELLDVVEKMMPVFLTGMLIFGLQRACQTTFIALKQSATSLFIALLRKVILLIPLAIILPRAFGLGVFGVFLAESLADFTAAAICTTIFFVRFKGILDRGVQDK